MAEEEEEEEEVEVGKKDNSGRQCRRLLFAQKKLPTLLKSELLLLFSIIQFTSLALQSRF